jgi:hypothetical protein
MFPYVAYVATCFGLDLTSLVPSHVGLDEQWRIGCIKRITLKY